MVSKDPLLQPFSLRHLTLKNRIMSTSHTMLYSVDGAPQQRYQIYHEEKARLYHKIEFNSFSLEI